VVRKVITFVVSAVTVGCAAQQPWSFNPSDFYNVKELPYDSPPQVIYRIDDHRFVTLERYRDCNHGEAYYNDTLGGIRSPFRRGTVENFQGRIVNADPTGRNLVFPSSKLPETICGDRGCTVTVAYSTDGGRSFHSMVYMRYSFKPCRDSRDYTFTATKDAVYITRKLGETTSRTSTDRYPMVPGFTYGDKPNLPDGSRIQFDAKVPAGLSTPSGQDRISCDASIKPTNPDVPLVNERQ
jgi:hypothetical protein